MFDTGASHSFIADSTAKENDLKMNVLDGIENKIIFGNNTSEKILGNQPVHNKKDNDEIINLILQIFEKIPWKIVLGYDFVKKLNLVPKQHENKFTIFGKTYNIDTSIKICSSNHQIVTVQILKFS